MDFWRNKLFSVLSLLSGNVASTENSRSAPFDNPNKKKSTFPGISNDISAQNSNNLAKNDNSVSRLQKNSESLPVECESKKVDHIITNQPTIIKNKHSNSTSSTNDYSLLSNEKNSTLLNKFGADGNGVKLHDSNISFVHRTATIDNDEQHIGCFKFRRVINLNPVALDSGYTVIN